MPTTRWGDATAAICLPHMRQKREPRQAYLAGLVKPAVTYFPAEQYHRRQGLNCCVRDGNRCFPLSMFTGKSFGGFSAAEGVFA